LLVHKSFYARDAKVYAIQELRNQIGGQHVYPIHRLDRKTSGILLFTLDKVVLKIMNDRFATREVEKKYLAILHGW
jgi:tRNA pseudouridine65 synthase